MASEIRVNQIQNRTGLSTVTFTDTGSVIAGVTTVQGSLNVTNGITANQITVGDTFLKERSIGIGTTTTAGRNAGVGTDSGTIIYNSDVKQLQVYNGSTGWFNLGGGYVEASGGTVSEYQDGSVFYRAHKFANSGQFSVHNAPENAKIDYLLIGGGGSGGTGGPGGRSGGGGGAGLLRYQTNQSISEGSYNITIGAGGVGSISNVIGNPGTASVLELDLPQLLHQEAVQVAGDPLLLTKEVEMVDLVVVVGLILVVKVMETLVVLTDLFHQTKDGVIMVKSSTNAGGGGGAGQVWWNW